MRIYNLKHVLVGLSVTSILSAISAIGLYAQDTAPAVSGELTPEIQWHIEDGTLYLSGQGVVPTTMFGQKSAWYDSRSLFHAVVVEDGITEIGRLVFNYHKNITSITLAGSVKNLAPNSFSGCSKLKTVEVQSSVPPNISVGVFVSSKIKNAKLIVPSGSKAVYEADPNWVKFGSIEESDRPAANTSETQAALFTEPCTIHLKRPSNFVGGGRSVSIFLNDAEQTEKLSNGKTVVMQTDRAQNELAIKQGKNTIAIYRFEAVAGGEIRIEFSYVNGNFALEE